MSMVIDSFIVVLTPLLILAYLGAALLIWRRKISRDENGIYTAMVCGLIVIAGSWVLVEINYIRNLFDLLDSPADIFSVRAFRLALVIFGIFNLYQYYKAMQ